MLGVCLLAVAGCTTALKDSHLPDLGTIKDFSLTERSERTVSLADLKGKVWIASFVFTRCTGPCPQISATMARLQKELADEPDRVRLVTFTVDAKADGTKELQSYAKSFQADAERWLFLTGDEAAIHKLVKESFMLPVERVKGPKVPAGAEVEHSTRLVLVDQQGHIRGFYSGMVLQEANQPDKEFAENLKKLRADVAALLRENP
jgi:cytochrome oxidase Cu insertion factor (SCO1/SenC/PrrC family)